MKCKNKKCKTCPSILDDCNYIDDARPICKTQGKIYMLSCGECNVKYIGQTGTAFNLRINNHRNLCNKVTFGNNDTNFDIQSKHEFEHFKIHPFKKVKIEILDIVPEQNRRLELENYYIIKYKTAYPYGLNDRVNGVSMTSVKNDNCVYSNVFGRQNPANNINNNRVRSKNKNKNNRYVDFPRFLEVIDNETLKQKDLVKYVKGKILGLKISKCKVLVKHVIKYNFKYKLLKDLVCDLIKFKLKCNQFESVVEKFDSYLVIEFSHKYVDLLNLSQLLHSPELIKTFPSKETYPKITYKYTPTIGSVVFNYSKFSKEIQVDNIDNYPCTCTGSRFKDDFHDHIVTGNLDIIDDERIRSIFEFGTNYRLVPHLNIDKIMNDIINSLNTYISKMTYKLKLNLGFFTEWKSLFIRVIYNKIAITHNIYPVTVNFNYFKNKITELQNQRDHILV